MSHTSFFSLIKATEAELLPVFPSAFVALLLQECSHHTARLVQVSLLSGLNLWENDEPISKILIKILLLTCSFRRRKILSNKSCTIKSIIKYSPSSNGFCNYSFIFDEYSKSISVQGSHGVYSPSPSSRSIASRNSPIIAPPP